MATRIYTRTGDSGETGLFGGQRVGKDAPRVEACGTVDELNSLLGLARSWMEWPDLADLLVQIQSDLFALGADLATPEEADTARGCVTVTRITADRVEALESEIDRLEAELPPLTRFILPGGVPAAGYLHFARSVCRRAERRCVALAHTTTLNPEILRYLNRLSDMLFVMARTANRRLGVEDVTWKP
ncbi:MAG TPA: cob(I)yrinic acid a,c-diamide adenosyltransferase [Chthonomonadales bacterium]|nr:cob(I)yrinic acid a,c-diamide adenosyltransferase [Chthonomonadales bacterium]